METALKIQEVKENVNGEEIKAVFFFVRGCEQRRAIDCCWKKSSAEGKFLTLDHNCEIETNAEISFNLDGNKHAFEKLAFL